MQPREFDGNYKVEHQNPIQVKADERVEIGRADDGYPHLALLSCC
jgi:hypothetical protein